jgi:hypothetical protein
MTLTLELLDRDEALTESIAVLQGDTRAELLRKAVVGGAAMLATLAAPAPASAAVSDVEILNFCLRFERLQATFYTEADEFGTIRKMPAAKQRWAEVLGAHERAHVRIIKKILGRKAGKRPFFDFHGVTESDEGFTRTAVAMEDLTVALLTGIVPQVHDRALTAALLGLLTVEARHAAWARHIVGTVPAPAAFDTPKTLHQVRGVLARTRFIAAQPKMTAKRKPKYTG